jgi:hypothetical protein
MTRLQKLWAPPIVDIDKGGRIFVDPNRKNTYRIFLNGQVEEISTIQHIVNFLENVTEEDSIDLIMAGSGGNVDTCIYLISAMNRCKAIINVVAFAPCASCSASIALSGSSLRLVPGSYLMFHNYSTKYEETKGNDLKCTIYNDQKWIYTFFGYTDTPFLDRDEIKEIENGKTIYIHWDDKDINKRLKRHFNALKHLYKKYHSS